MGYRSNWGVGKGKVKVVGLVDDRLKVLCSVFDVGGIRVYFLGFVWLSLVCYSYGYCLFGY